MPTFIRPARVTVSDDGSGAGLALAGIAAAVAAAFLIAAATAAVARFVLAYSVVLCAGAGVIAGVILAGVWVLRRWFTVVYFNPDAMRARRAVPPRAVVHLHRHVIEYAPAPAAIQNPPPLPGAVIAAAIENEEIPR